MRKIEYENRYKVIYGTIQNLLYETIFSTCSFFLNLKRKSKKKLFYSSMECKCLKKWQSLFDLLTKSVFPGFNFVFLLRNNEQIQKNLAILHQLREKNETKIQLKLVYAQNC